MMADTTGMILADECGLGKTVSAIEAVKRTRTHVTDWRALVICPPTLMQQWVDEIENQDPGAEFAICVDYPYDFEKFHGWVITSIYSLRRSVINKQFQKVLWDYVIIDEAHRIKGRNTLTATEAKHIPKVRGYCLTGTPMETSPADYWSLLDFITDGQIQRYWGWVKKHLIVEDGYFTKWDIKGPKDPEAFGEYLAPYVLRRTKEEVAPWLPEKLLFETKVAMTPDQEKLYKELKAGEDIIVPVGDQELIIQNVLTQIVRAQQLSSMPMLLGYDVPSGKMAWCDEFVEDHPDDPIAFFSNFREVAMMLRGRYGAAVVIGGQDESERFKNGSVQYVAGTISAMGEGLNLQRARHAIFIDSHQSSRMMTQAIDRVHRMDIKEPKNIYLLHSCKEDRAVLKSNDEKWTEQEFVYYWIDKAQHEV